MQEIYSAPTVSVSIADVFALSHDIVELNIGYLGISVTVLILFAGFVGYFNIQPLKEALGRQEKNIEKIKTEAEELVTKTKKETDERLTNFSESQQKEISENLKREEEKILLSAESLIKTSSAILRESIEKVSEEKDTKLKEFLISETKNESARLDKSLSTVLNSFQEKNSKLLEGFRLEMEEVKNSLKDLKRDVRGLKIYKFSKEGQMGAIIYSIEQVKDDIDEDRWSTLSSLDNLLEEIRNIPLDSSYIAQIDEQLERLKDNPRYRMISDEIRKAYLRKEAK